MEKAAVTVVLADFDKYFEKIVFLSLRMIRFEMEVCCFVRDVLRSNCFEIWRFRDTL